MSHDDNNNPSEKTNLGLNDDEGLTTPKESDINREDLREEVVSTLEKITEEEDTAKQQKKDIKEAKLEIEDLKKKYENELDKIEEKKENVDDIESNLSDLEETASDLLNRTTSSALGEQFAKRKKEMETALRGWKVASVFSILLLLGASWVIYTDIGSSSTGVTSNITKIGLLLPISVAVWFCVSNYTRQKKLMEEYEFKARMAVSLIGFREALNNESDGDNEELILEFMIETMEKIYTNPQNNINTENNNPDPQSTQTALLELIRNN